MTPDPKYVIEVATRLQAAQEAAARVQAEWDAIFLSVPPQPNRNATRTAKPDSAVMRTKQFFLDNPNKLFGSPDIAKELGIPVASTRTNVAKLYKQGIIEKVDEGVYCARGSFEVPLISSSDSKPENS